MLVLDGFCIIEVHLERISKPTETFLDEGWGHTSLVKEHTGPDMEGMGRIFFEVVGQGGWLHLLYCFAYEFSNPAAGNV